MIKLKEIPIGELTRELINQNDVYCKYDNNPLKKVSTKASLEIGTIQSVKFYIEDTPEVKSEMTWGETFKEFIKQHKALEPLIDDYRPSDKPYTIRLWTKAPFNTEFVVTYQPDINMFIWRQ